MKKILSIIVINLAIVLNMYAGNISLETAYMKLEINEKGYIVSIFDKLNNSEYFPAGQNAPLLSIRCNGEIENPSLIRQKSNKIILQFDRNKVEAQIMTVIKQDYISFELSAITHPETVELIVWGPYPTTISKTIGECVGVVRDGQFAIGIQSLNVKTLGGYPSEENDIEPSYDILTSANKADITPEWKNKKVYRGQTARVMDFGSILQAYCRNRNKERIISNWNHEYYVAPAFNDGGVIGSKIALFGSPAGKALDIIGQIEISEGLPHPVIDGEWLKEARSATASYLIMAFNENNLDRALEITKKAGLKYLYHGGPFKSWGHFVLDEKEFPENWTSMKRCVDRANAQGIKLGVHTLSNFINTNDAYVSPVPDKRLAKVGESIITENIGAESEEIYIKSPTYFNQMKNNSLHSVVIGDEIIRYREVSSNAPWKLLGCQRGAFDTKASPHKSGEVIGKLMDHGYKVFLSNEELSEEISKSIAKLFNETGLMQISFDGLEGVWSTGMGQYARSLFTKTWYDNLKPELRGKVINDASNPSHFNWHINTRYNWGEPWYAGFRESQTNYRLMNQDFYQRNLLPSMLGWFSMSNQTSVEDTEWLLARAAGFDAGFAFNLSFENIEKNGQSEAILKAINTWETARMAGAFSSEQKLKMQNINNEYHLELNGEGKWLLYSYQIKRYVHEQKERQPGEPLYSTFEFKNPYKDQPMMFILNLLPAENNIGSSVNNITLEVNDYYKIEIPVEMEPFQILKLDETGKLQLFDKNWNLIRIIVAEGKIPVLSKGDNKINFDAEFSGEGSSKVKIEMKTIGEAETVSIGKK
ncbi:MAG TPA: hypothetical protein PLR88_00325 [Bacteroidales bacterium]|nr:hypothetical protein [Bacteroidales bacterium]HPT20360.1 hypothetical protein [Bacteroidales bacterium]